MFVLQGNEILIEHHFVLVFYKQQFPFIELKLCLEIKEPQNILSWAGPRRIIKIPAPDPAKDRPKNDTYA